MGEVRVRRAGPGDEGALERLVAEFPYKQLQQRIQGLERERLLAFFQAGLRRSVERGVPLWVAERAGRVVGVAGLSEASGQSKVYEMKMGRVQPWINVEAPEAFGALHEAVVGAARAEGFAHLQLRVDGADFVNLHALEEAGWRLVDVSMKFSREFGEAHRAVPMPEGAREWIVEQARPEDAEWILELGGRTHGGTHYLNDPALPAERTRALFGDWLRRCVDGLADRIYVVRDEAGRGLGFVTYLVNEGFANAVGRRPLILDFVLLAPETRGRGVGPWFIEQTLAREAERGFDYCELRTSAHNLGAVTCYEKLGFLCCATDFVVHRLV